MPKVSPAWLGHVADVMQALLNTVAVQQTHLLEYDESYREVEEKTDSVLLQGQEIVHNIRSNASK